jgi:hypothetical protein
VVKWKCAFDLCDMGYENMGNMIIELVSLCIM